LKHFPSGTASDGFTLDAGERGLYSPEEGGDSPECVPGGACGAAGTKRGATAQETRDGAAEITTEDKSAGAGAKASTATDAGAESDTRQQAGRAPFSGEDIGALSPMQQAWLAPVGWAHRGATHERERAATSRSPNIFRAITLVYHATQLPARASPSSVKAV